MAFQSPYQDQPPKFPLLRQVISRGTMLLLGLVLAYYVVTDFASLMDYHARAATQPTFGNRRETDETPWPWLILIGLGLFSSFLIVGAVIPLSVLQKLFETFNAPAALGDRSHHPRGGRF